MLCGNMGGSDLCVPLRNRAMRILLNYMRRFAVDRVYGGISWIFNFPLSVDYFLKNTFNPLTTEPVPEYFSIYYSYG